MALSLSLLFSFVSFRQHPPPFFNTEREEKKLVADIKKFAKQGQMGSVKIMAKDLVRTRQYITKFIEMRSHLQGAGLKLQTVKSHQAMAESMGSVAKAMVKMNKAGKFIYI